MAFARKPQIHAKSCLGDFDGFADLAPSGEVPSVRKTSALDGLHLLDAAIAAFEKNARAIRLVDKRESVASRAQAGEVLDEVVFRVAEEF